MSHTVTASSFIKSAFSRRRGFSSVRLPLVLSLLNQFVSSGGNFLVGIYLARTLPLEDFGLYGIGFAICMLYVGLGSALILTQMVVNMPDKAPGEKEKYAARMFCGVLLLNALVLALVAVFFATAVVVTPEHARFMGIVAAIAVASVLFLCNEFFISYAYLKRRETLALMVNVITISILIGGLIIERKLGWALNARNVLLLYALGAAVASIAAYLFSPLRLADGIRKLMPDFIEAWQHGRWALGGVGVTWVQSQAYTYVLAFFMGPAGVGLANAARIFISPFSFLLPAINKIAIPRLADLRNTDPQRMFRISLLMTAGLTALTILYSLLLLSSVGPVSQLVLGRHDPRIESLIWVWCLVLIFQIARSGGGVLMQVQRKFRNLTLINIPSAIVTLVAAVVLMQGFGTVGAIWGMAAGELVLLILIWREIAHDRTR